MTAVEDVGLTVKDGIVRMLEWCSGYEKK